MTGQHVAPTRQREPEAVRRWPLAGPCEHGLIAGNAGLGWLGTMVTGPGSQRQGGEGGEIVTGQMLQTPRLVVWRRRACRPWTRTARFLGDGPLWRVIGSGRRPSKMDAVRWVSVEEEDLRALSATARMGARSWCPGCVGCEDVKRRLRRARPSSTPCQMHNPTWRRRWPTGGGGPLPDKTRLGSELREATTHVSLHVLVVGARGGWLGVTPRGEHGILSNTMSGDVDLDATNRCLSLAALALAKPSHAMPCSTQRSLARPVQAAGVRPHNRADTAGGCSFPSPSSRRRLRRGNICILYIYRVACRSYLRSTEQAM